LAADYIFEKMSTKTAEEYEVIFEREEWATNDATAQHTGARIGTYRHQNIDNVVPQE
jgi:hypothetical protein